MDQQLSPGSPRVALGEGDTPSELMMEDHMVDADQLVLTQELGRGAFGVGSCSIVTSHSIPTRSDIL